MGIFNFNSRRESRKQEETKIYKSLRLPETVINDLKLYQDAYGFMLSEEEDQSGNPIPARLMLAEMLTMWMENVELFDKDVYDDVQFTKRMREEHPQRPVHHVDPTEGEVWKLRYLAERDGEEIEMKPDSHLGFVGRLNGKKVGLEVLIDEEWTFMNEVGIEITLEQAKEISRKILGHGLQERIRFKIVQK